jgi:hypothetical protein
MNGNDANLGTSLSFPLATIGEALIRAKALDLPCTVNVYPGEYQVDPDTEIPTNCLLYGYDLRVTKLSLPAGQEQNNMFLMNSGIKVKGFTFTNLQHEPYNFNVSTNTFNPPNKGFAFAFVPGATILRSPYISDCTTLHNFSQLDLTRPIDRDAGNPDMPTGGGCINGDGSVLNPDTPLRSVVVANFTAVNPNGIAYVMQRDAFAQLVSVFTNWSRVGLWCHEGGQMTVANSNTTFGDYALVSSKFRLVIQIPDTPASQLDQYVAEADAIINNFESIVLDSLQLSRSLGIWEPFFEPVVEQDIRDIVNAVAFDLQSGQDRAIQRVTKRFFQWNGDFNPGRPPVALTREVILQVRAALFDRVLDANARTMTELLLEIPRDVLLDVEQNGSSSQYLIVFPSVIEASGQQLSNSGSGVNYNSLPASQRGTGGNPDPLSTIIEAEGGRVYATFATELGDTYLGLDLRVDFQRNTIEGQSFSRGVQNITLPLIQALGG